MRVSLSDRQKRCPKPVYRLRAYEGGRVVTDPDGTVSRVGTTDRIRVTGVYQEPFASLFAEPFDAKRMAKAIVEMDPAQRERINQLHQKLYPPKAKRRKRRGA